MPPAHQELPGCCVTVVAEAFGTDLTSAGAAGYWEPFKLSNTPQDKVHRCAGVAACFVNSARGLQGGAATSLEAQQHATSSFRSLIVDMHS